MIMIWSFKQLELFLLINYNRTVWAFKEYSFDYTLSLFKLTSLYVLKIIENWLIKSANDTYHVQVKININRHKESILIITKLSHYLIIPGIS